MGRGIIELKCCQRDCTAPAIGPRTTNRQDLVKRGGSLGAERSGVQVFVYAHDMYYAQVKKCSWVVDGLVRYSTQSTQ